MKLLIHVNSKLNLGMIFALISVGGCQSQDLASKLVAAINSTSQNNHSDDIPGSGTGSHPIATLRLAPHIEFPNNRDCNNPLFWDGGTLHVFNSVSGEVSKASGPNVSELTSDGASPFSNGPGGWMESVIKADDGILYGWYHQEPFVGCNLQRAPLIGAAMSFDNGSTWRDLGIIIRPRSGTTDCSTQNPSTAGGNGDFSVLLDGNNENLYFYFSNYAGDISEQGISVARMNWSARKNPVGKIQKWHNGSWGEPGLEGLVTPLFNDALKFDWMKTENNGYWGPSIHWNNYLNQYIILMNRSRGANYLTEGLYATYSKDLSDPNSWTVPDKIQMKNGFYDWYPQVVGDSSIQGTDKLAGQTSRFFVSGRSDYEITFSYPDQMNGPFFGNPSFIPGSIEAENFDTGTEGVAFHEKSQENQGGEFRATPVDIGRSTEGGYAVGGIDDGEWLKYTVNITASGTYALWARVATPNLNSRFHMEIDGINVSGTITVPNTGEWQSWQTVASRTFNLTSGTHALKIVFDGGGFNLDNFKIIAHWGVTPPDNAPSFFGNTQPQLPGRIEAENFDGGGEGFAYHDVSPTNLTGIYRQTDVDIGDCSEGGYNVGWAESGEWLNYSAKVTAVGSYTISARVATIGNTSKFHVEVDGKNVTGTINVPNTGDWQQWHTVTSKSFSLSEGEHTFRFVFDSGGFNFNYFDLVQ